MEYTQHQNYTKSTEVLETWNIWKNLNTSQSLGDQTHNLSVL
jgi:hypothetical protein